MEAVIEQSFGEIHGGNPGGVLELLQGDDEFVAGAALGISQVEAGSFQLRCQVVGVERGKFGHSPHPPPSQHACIDPGAQEHAHIAAEGGHPTYGPGTVALLRPAIRTEIFQHVGNRQERPQALRHTDRTGTRAATTMRGGERLVQVHVYDVEAHVTRPHPPEDGVEVGAVVITQAAGFVDDILDRNDAFLEHTQGGWVGKHESRRVRADAGLECVQVNIALAIRGNFPDRVAAHAGSGGVGAVRGVRNDDFAPGRVSTGIVIGTDHRHPGELSMRAGHGRHAHCGHAGDLLEHLLQLIQANEKTLPGIRVRQRVARQKLWQHGQRVADAWVVFHGAGAERVKLGVDAEVLLRKSGVMAHHVEFRGLRQKRWLLAQQFRRQVVGLLRVAES